jgi:hypothetical protein
MSVINVICEDPQGSPLPYGVWGVNPHSVQNIVYKMVPYKVKKQPKKKAVKNAKD